MQSTPTPLDYLPIVLMFLVALGFVITTMIASHWLGPKRKTKIKLDSFECGIEAQGNARLPFAIKYFLVAILFVLFDIEVIFMYPWAVVYKSMLADPATRNMILGSMLSFLGILFVGYIYAVKKKAFDWKS